MQTVRVERFIPKEDVGHFAISLQEAQSSHPGDVFRRDTPLAKSANAAMNPLFVIELFSNQGKDFFGDFLFRQEGIRADR